MLKAMVPTQTHAALSPLEAGEQGREPRGAVNPTQLGCSQEKTVVVAGLESNVNSRSATTAPQRLGLRDPFPG